METDAGLSTRCVHAGEIQDVQGSPHTPIYTTTTFKFKSTADLLDVVEGRKVGNLYTRYGSNPTIRALEDKLAALEGAEANSKILNRPAKHNDGVTRGAIERERGLSAALRLAKSTDTFAQNLKEFVSIWISRVDWDNPWFVALNEKEFQLIVEVLLKLGVNESQLKFCYCNIEIPRLKKLLSKQAFESAVAREFRFSKGSNETKESEIGIRVEQEINSIIGDNRDTHRLALMLAAISRTELN